MVQRILSLAFLLAVILWIVLSYIPDTLLTLPTVAFTGSGRVLAALAVIALVIFVILQGIVLRATAASVRAYHRSHPDRPPFRLSLSAELFWTALPLGMTLALAWAGYALWAQLTIR